jgi:ABC-type antimicrobial peptide transport system permease subunit
VIILSISSILGCGLGYVGVDALMGSIWKYYQSTTSITFVVSVALMFLISAIAIGYKVFNAASMNPVKTLRDE